MSCTEKSENSKQNYCFLPAVLFDSQDYYYFCTFPGVCLARSGRVCAQPCIILRDPDPIASLGNRAKGLPWAQSRSGGGRSDLLYT